MFAITEKYAEITKSVYHSLNQLEHNIGVDLEDKDESLTPMARDRLKEVEGHITSAADSMRAAYYLCRPSRRMKGSHRIK